MNRAAIDVGSNSVLLLVESFKDGRWHTLCETSEVTGLGVGTKATGLLAEPGMSDTLAAVRRAYDKAHELNVDEVRAGGTMALRIAKNTDEFLARAEKQRTPVRVLSGNQEAELGFKAVVEDPLFASEPTISIIDVGGQSTELATAHKKADGWDATFRKSFSIGTLALRDKLMAAQSPTATDRLASYRFVDDVVGQRYLARECGKVVTLGATGTNLVSIRDRLATWQPEKVHGAVLTLEDVSRSLAHLCELDDAGRAAVVGMEKGREKTIHIGALILEVFMNVVGAEAVVVSVRGWRHALLEGGWPD